ncbi:Brix domain-containing protein [Pisolithus microcarpus]|nr:Brix domain-containing protein [Pisolithus microcarpus]
MARRRKHRNPPEGEDGIPKSFVVKHGQVGTSLAQLVRDLRKVMEPNTASRLKERKRNKLKGFFAMAPALKVTHLLALTLTDLAPSLRLVRLPVGPTFSFRVERYSLMKDVRKISRSAPSQGLEYLTAPLLVLASFPAPSPTTPAHLPLLMKAFQSMFPPLSPKSMSLSGARRIVLIAYNAERGTIDFRHYIITVKPYGVSKRVRRVLEGTSQKSSGSSSMTRVLDLGNERDVAGFSAQKKSEAGYESAASSASSAAGDDGDAVSLADDYVGRNNRRGQKKAVKLNEVGPRLELRLVKITEGVPGKDGEVLYHEFGTWPHIKLGISITDMVAVKKSRAEAAALRVSHAEKERLREKRKREQEENVRRKKENEAGRQQDSGLPREDSEHSAEEGDEEQSEGEWDEEGGGETDAESESEGFEEPPAEEVENTNKNVTLMLPSGHLLYGV